jgi:hypothetical protein
MKKNKYTFLYFLLFTLQVIMAAEYRKDIPLTDIEYEGSLHKAIHRADMFPYFMGMPEEQFYKELKNNNGNPPESPQKTTILLHQLRRSSYTLEELKNTSTGFISPQGGKLSLDIVDLAQNPDLRHLIDIGANQARYPGALFQTASRPNGLEGHQIRYQNNKNTFNVTKNGVSSIMGRYAVQGEEAQISCFIKGVHDIYFSYENTNLFEALGIEIDAKGDVINIKNPEELEKASAQELSEKIRSNYHYAPVSTGYANVKFQTNNIKQYKSFDAQARYQNDIDANILLPNPCRITQANVSAIDMDEKRDTMITFRRIYGTNSANVARKVALAAQIANIQAPILYANLNGIKEVIITPMGTGSFKNPMDGFIEAVVMSEEIIKKSNCNVVLIAPQMNGSLTNNPAWGRIEAVVKNTGGNVNYHKKSSL